MNVGAETEQTLKPHGMVTLMKVLYIRTSGEWMQGMYELRLTVDTLQYGLVLCDASTRTTCLRHLGRFG